MEKLTIASFAVLFTMGGAQAQAAGEMCADADPACDVRLVCDPDEKICKLTLYGVCDPDNDLCSADHVCDRGCTVCKMRVGRSCTLPHSLECFSHATCDDTDSTCQCVAGYNPTDDDKKCSASTVHGSGESCSDGFPCGVGMICYPVDQICKILPGKTCGENDVCIDHTFCDTESSQCRVRAGISCTPGVMDRCLLHATCQEGSQLCVCDIGYIAINGDTESARSKAGTVIVSLTLMAASVLASRFF